MVTQEHELNLVPGRPSTVVHVSQYDKDSRDIVFTLYSGSEEFSIPSSASVKCEGTKNDKRGFSHACTFTGNKVTVRPSDDMTAVSGDTVCEIVIEDKGQRLGSANFILKVEDGALGDGTDMSPSDVAQAYDILEKAEEATNSANDAAALIDGMTVSASKVAAGGTPTAKLTKKSGHYDLALGLVTGDKGDKGDTPTISIAETVTGAPGDPAKVENVGTATDPKLKFTIPLGNQGPVTSVNGQQGDVAIGGRNYIIQKDLVVGYINKDTGALVSTSATDAQASRTTDYIDVSVTDNLTMSVSGVPQQTVKNHLFWLAVSFYDADKTFIFRKAASSDDVELGAYYKLVKTVTKPANAVYARASFYYTNIENCQAKLEFGNVATDWSPAPEDTVPYYKVGDTITVGHRSDIWKCFVCGGVLASKKQWLYFSIPFGKSIDPSATLKIVECKGKFFGINGAVDNVTESMPDMMTENFDVQIGHINYDQGQVTIWISKNPISEFSNSTNETPITAVIYMKFDVVKAISADVGADGPEIMNDYNNTYPEFNEMEADTE